MLNQSIKSIKGIGDKKASFFKNMGVSNLYDLLSLYPFRYEDLSKATKISDMEDDVYYVFVARVVYFESSYSKGGKKMIKVELEDDSSSLEAIFVNMPYLKSILKKGEIYWFYGKCSTFGNYKSTFHPEFFSYENYPNGMGIRPIYSLSGDLKQKDVKSSIEACKNLFELIAENLPDEIIKKENLMQKNEAMFTMHFPKSFDDLERAKYRLKFEEIYLQQEIISNKRKVNKEAKRKHLYDEVSSDEIYSLFDFEMTNSQKSAITEMKDDLQSDILMNRLLFGDVGSGKTAIAISLSYIAVKNGYQACIMAPTEVLARQHYSEFSKTLGDYYNVELLVSSVKNKNEITDLLKSGEIDIIIGTHALIEDNVIFNKLSMIITDEEHRFGVNQRKALKNKAISGADYLSMSATPIPRTLSMIHYGDLDISYLTDMPKNRKKIITKYVNGNESKRKLLKFIYDAFKNGEQAYFLAPRIEDYEEQNKNSVEKMYKSLSSIFKGFEIAYLHGKMKAEEKNQIMSDFKLGKIQALVSTTVVEVGVDVPNATIIVISQMENFGLSQLHQLRGRVGRGDKQSYCFLISDNKNENTAMRIEAMQNYDSGFDLAEIDLKMRGAGDILGTRQHGFKQFKLVDYFEDRELIEKVASLF